MNIFSKSRFRNSRYAFKNNDFLILCLNVQTEFSDSNGKTKVDGK